MEKKIISKDNGDDDSALINGIPTSNNTTNLDQALVGDNDSTPYFLDGSYHSLTSLKNLDSIDYILKKYGYGFITWKFIIIISVIITIHGYYRTFIYTFLIPLQEYYSLNTYQLDRITFISFFAGILGSLMIIVLPKISRISFINISYLVILICHIAMLLTSSLIFESSRYITGIALGCSTPIAYNIFAEYLPIKNRGITLNLVFLGYGMGQLIPLFIMYYTMPNLEYENMMYTFKIMLFIPIFGCILVYFLYHDSPRHLILINKNEEAFNLLKNLNDNIELDDRIKEKIITESKEGSNNKTGDGTFSSLFSKYFIKRTILSSILMLSNVISYHGPMLILSLTLVEVNKLLTSEKCNVSLSSNIIVEQILVITTKQIFQFLSLLTEIKSFGRLGTMGLLTALAILSIVLFFFYPMYATSLLGISIGCTGVLNELLKTYCIEIYPTKIRDIAASSTNIIVNIGGGISQILFLGLNSYGIFIPYYLMFLLLIIQVVIIYILPYETVGESIDKDFEETIKSSDKSNTIGLLNGGE